MYNDLSSGIKSSITRSISKAFELYMAKIGWDENSFTMEDFVKSWQEYITESASWYDKVPLEVKESTDFHEEVAKKINASIEKILAEPVHENLIASIEVMQNKLNTHYKYGCKAEALYVESVLKELEKQA
ncbi:hypothetical protein MHB48_03390 [Psychrobacillus sp. FSL H8-0483]|uniref:hypothetical protein n=1 Tax=Psychrobacillus sp. FSL H8-0483 TaxID=2921389 RepID=UPI00315A0B31